MDISGLTIAVEFLESRPPLVAMQTPSNCVSDTHMLATAPYVAGEVATMRNRMVRQVDWLLIDIRSYEDECICSPLFSAGGVDNLQLQFYPNGYRAKQPGNCGFFLKAPVGSYLKCRAFVGSVDKVFEHTFDTSAPYGRGNFCRTSKALANGTDMRCGIEILEVYQDWTKVTNRGKEAANILKIRSATSGIEDVLEIRGSVMKKSLISKSMSDLPLPRGDSDASPPSPNDMSPALSPEPDRGEKYRELPRLR